MCVYSCKLFPASDVKKLRLISVSIRLCYQIISHKISTVCAEYSANVAPSPLGSMHAANAIEYYFFNEQIICSRKPKNVL